MDIELSDCIWKEGDRWGMNTGLFDKWLSVNANKYTSPYNFCVSEDICYQSTLKRRLGSDKVDSYNWNYNKNHNKRKGLYQNYDWLYDKFIIKGMNIQEIAKLSGVKKRTIQKWLVEKHRLTGMYRIENKKITNKQKELIIAGMLGDGHIDKREGYPIYIESHAENQKDYLYWKYNLLKDICNQEPRKINKHVEYFNSKPYNIQNQYRFITRSIYDIKEIREMDITSLLNNINDFILSVWILDDGYRAPSRWEICVARFNNKEKIYLTQLLKERFDISGYFNKDDRYCVFNKSDSGIIDDIILQNIPNDLDIIKYKVLDKK